MLRVFVAEDIEIVLENIISNLKAFPLELEVCGTATDGAAALEKIMEARPDILITDIRMPKLDGIRLIEAVKKVYPATKCIILSGYADFEYARESVKLKVTEYLLKPLKVEELFAAVQKAVEDIELERKLNDEYSKSIEKDKRLVKIEGLLAKLLFTGYVDRDIGAISEDPGFDMREAYIALLLIHLGDAGNGAASIDMKFKSAWAAVEGIVKKLYERNTMGFLIPNAGTGNEMVLVLAAGDGDRLPGQARVVAADISGIIKNETQLSFAIGASSVKKGLDSARQALEEAGRALESRFVKGMGKVFTYTDSTEPAGRLSSLFRLDFSALEKSLEERDTGFAVKSCRKVLEGIFSAERLLQYPYISVSSLFAETAMRLANYARKLDLDFSGNIREGVLTGKALADFNSLEEIIAYLLDLTGRIMDLRNRKIKDGSFNADRVKEYLDKNFMEKLTLNDVAMKFSVNPKYLSDAFKKKSGINFIEYVNKLKIDSAKKLLKETSLNIDSISETLGFNSRFYFFKVFRKYTGTTPQEYRNK